MPKRKLLTVRDFEGFFRKEKGLIFDAAGQRAQRPPDHGQQKETCPGKKANTLKSMPIPTKSKAINYPGHCPYGKGHGFSSLKKGFPPNRPWFKSFNVKVDLGYLGIVKGHGCQPISIPYKKSKNNPLADEQESVNKQSASERIFVGHGLSGLKRFRVLADRLRVHGIGLYDDILGVCAGLWNFYLAN